MTETEIKILKAAEAFDKIISKTGGGKHGYTVRKMADIPFAIKLINEGYLEDISPEFGPLTVRRTNKTWEA